MGCDDFYTGSEEGRDQRFARRHVPARFRPFALFVLNDGVISNNRVLPEGLGRGRRHSAFAIVPDPTPIFDITHYGYSWWLGRDVMSALELRRPAASTSSTGIG